MNGQANAAFAAAGRAASTASSDLAQAAGLQSQLYTTVPVYTLEYVTVGGSPASTSRVCGPGGTADAGGVGVGTWTCKEVTTPGTSGLRLPRYVQTGTKQVLNKDIQDQIDRLQKAAAQAQQEAADDNKRGTTLAAKALGLLGQWTATREEAATAANQAAAAAGYAAEEKGRTQHLSQVASADEAAARRAEIAYERLEAIYVAEQLKSTTTNDRGTHRTKHPPKPKDPPNPGTPPAPNLRVTDTTPPAYQGPWIDAATSAADGLPLTMPGPYARVGVALVDGEVDDAVQLLINEAGKENGCHSCGATSSGTLWRNWIVDHQPPTKLVSPGTPQTGFP